MYVPNDKNIKTKSVALMIQIHKLQLQALKSLLRAYVKPENTKGHGTEWPILNYLHEQTGI